MSGESDRYATLLDLIYSCITNAEGWVDVLEQLCTDTGCVAGTILSTDLTTRGIQHFFSWNFGREVLERLHEFGDESAKVWQTLPGFWFRDLDEPGTSMREAPRTYGESRWVAEVMAPMGIIDSLHLILLRSSERVADIALFRHGSQGHLGDVEIEVLRRYAPHLRRSMEVSHILEMKTIDMSVLSSALDELPAAILIVDHLGELRHANAKARQLLAAGSAIVLQGNRVTATSPNARIEFYEAIEAAFAKLGSVIALPGGDPVAGVAYVSPLPIRSAPGRPDILALVVVPVNRSTQRLDFEAVARIFGLSAAETRVLQQLLTGETLANVARSLDLAESTVKSQRMAIFAKTGVSRRAELTELMSRFMVL